MTPAQFRAAAVVALKAAVPLVAQRVFTGRVWPIQAGGKAAAPQMPALLVDTPRIRRTSNSRGGGAPEFRAVVTLTVIIRSERATEAEIQAELDAISEQVGAAILEIGSFRDTPEEWTEWETTRDVEWAGERLIGQDAHAFDAQFTQRHEPRDLPAFTGARMVLDAAEPFDRFGAYAAIAPFPAPAAPPRTSGPDGRREGETEITYPQS